MAGSVAPQAQAMLAKRRNLFIFLSIAKTFRVASAMWSYIGCRKLSVLGSFNSHNAVVLACSVQVNQSEETHRLSCSHCFVLQRTLRM
jgi:hypothetical protein